MWPDAHLGVRTVDTHIRRLREKLGAAAEVIETIRGVGYCLRAADEREAP
ncbi:MAG: winged helix-turn-helix domain-containing protein [Polyangiales bacterium]